MEKIIDEGELQATMARCTHIIDARSPAEYEEDHIPGAINVPVLDNQQRAEVGTLHREDAFAARKLGAAYATRAIHQFLKTPLIAEATRKTAMLIYCARGGQRSGSLGLVLSQVGFPIFRLRKGYKSWRAHVRTIMEQPLPGPVFVLHGYTGSRKTHILQALQGEVNVLDLEGHANHRGSLLGALPGIPQPGQKAFETRIYKDMVSFSADKPTLIEGESRKIGRVQLPDSIWAQMKAGRRLWLDMPRAKRAEYILEDYAELKDRDYLLERMVLLDRFLSRADRATLHEDLAAARWPDFVMRLLEGHYDPLYGRSPAREAEDPIQADDFEQALAAVRQRISS